MRITESVVSRGQIGFDGDGTAGFDGAFLKQAHHYERSGEITVCLGGCRLQLESPAVGCDGFLHSPLFGENHTQIAVGQRIVRPDPQQTPADFDRLVRALNVGERAAEIRQRFDIVGIDRKGASVFGDGFAIFLLIGEC